MKSTLSTLTKTVFAAVLFAFAPDAHAQRSARGGRSVRADGPTQVLSVLTRVRSNVRATRYRHELRVDESRGLYEWDCSLMASWILRRSAPRALEAVRGQRPLAADFYQAIQRAPATQPREGWLRIPRIAEARPGDVLAWRRPPWFRSRNSGHVAFVLSTPEPFAGGYLVRIADASSFNHEADTRRGTTGYGEGTLLVTTDPTTGEGTGYGWFGRHSGSWVVPTAVAIGRPMR